MAFDGTEAKSIDQAIAAEWTRNYRRASPEQPIAHFFGKDILLDILAQEGCMGIRLYYGLNGRTPQLLAVGADAEESDQLSGSSVVADDAPTSPPYMGQSNRLNS